MSKRFSTSMKCTQPCDDELFKFIFMLSICLFVFLYLFESKRASMMLYKINDLIVFYWFTFFLSLLLLYTLMIVYKLIEEKVWIIYFDEKTILSPSSSFSVVFFSFQFSSVYMWSWIAGLLHILEGINEFFSHCAYVCWCAPFLFTRLICCCCGCLYFFALSL